MTEAFGWGLAGAGLGAVVGSFVAVLLLRWPAGRTVRGRSVCDGCGAVLRWWELVPVVSYAALRGRCARCEAAIDRTQLFVEVGGAAIGGVALAAASGWPGLAGALLGWTLFALALLDLRHFWLPDRLTLPLGAVGLAVGPATLDARLIGAAAGYASFRLVAWGYACARGRVGLGAGDAKLFGAIGAWLGWRPLPQVLLLACALGLVWALALWMRGRDVGAATRLPFGAMLAAAGWGMWCFAYSAGA